MGLLEIVDQTFRLYRANFWLFFSIAAVLHIPLGLLQAAAQSFPIAIAAYILILPGYLVVPAVMTKAVSDRYMGDPATIGAAYGYIGRRLLPLIGTIICAYLLIGAGLILLVVGTIIFALWASFVTQVFVIEDKRYFNAIWRSKFLVGQGVWGEVIVLGLITGILALLIQSPALALSFIASGPGSSLWILQGLIAGLAQALALPVGTVSVILLYYDSRIRKEGFDLEMLARELGKQLPSVAPPQIMPPQAPAPPQWPPAPPQSTGEGGV